MHRLIILAAIFILAGCSADSPHDGNAIPQAVPAIQLRSAHRVLTGSTTANTGSTSKHTTRAPYGDAIDADNPLEARVLSATTAGGYAANLHANGKITFTDPNGTAGYDPATVAPEKEKFPSLTDNLYFLGLHPYNGWSNPDNNGIHFTFTGTEDLMLANEVTTNATQAESGNYARLTFAHLLTKIEIAVKAANPQTAALWGTVNRVELVKANGATPANEVTIPFNNPGAPVFTASTAAQPFPLYALAPGANADALAVLPTTTLTPVAYALIAPFEATGTATDLVFKVYTANAPAGQEVAVALNALDADGEVDPNTPFTGSTAGKAFAITFHFVAGNIEPAITLANWTVGGTTTGDL